MNSYTQAALFQLQQQTFDCTTRVQVHGQTILYSSTMMQDNQHTLTVSNGICCCQDIDTTSHFHNYPNIPKACQEMSGHSNKSPQHVPSSSLNNTALMRKRFLGGTALAAAASSASSVSCFGCTSSCDHLTHMIPETRGWHMPHTSNSCQTITYR